MKPITSPYPRIVLRRAFAAFSVICLSLSSLWAAPIRVGFDGLLIHRSVEERTSLIVEHQDHGAYLAETPVTAFGGQKGDLVTLGEAPSVYGLPDHPSPHTAWLKLSTDGEPVVGHNQAGRQRAALIAWNRAYSYLREYYEHVDSGELLAIEPDFMVSYELLEETNNSERNAQAPTPSVATGGDLQAFRNPALEWDDYRLMAGYLNKQYSQLRAAADFVHAEEHQPVRVAILDNGFLPQHRAFPTNAIPAVEIANPKRKPQNGRLGEPWYPSKKIWFNGSAHGTSTASILAGPRLTIGRYGTTPEYFSGGNPRAVVEPIRIGGSVVALGKPWTRTADIAKGFAWATQKDVDVISMSVGGLPSGALATAIDRAYRAGIPMFCAAGNHLVGKEGAGKVITTPKYVVYPAAFRPVMAVAGVTAERSSYGELPHDAWSHGAKFLQLGNRGPSSKMRNAIAAWTPNIPWVQDPISFSDITHTNDPWNHPGPWNIMNLDGSGTSAATPQAAATASLIISRHGDELNKYSHPWQRAEAVYWLLKNSTEPAPQYHFGHGYLRALEAVKHELPDEQDLRKKQKARYSWWYVLRLILSSAGSPASLATDAEIRKRSGELLGKVVLQHQIQTPSQNPRYFEVWSQMVATEVSQVIATDEKVSDLWQTAASSPSDAQARSAFMSALIEEGHLTSQTQEILRAAL